MDRLGKTSDSEEFMPGECSIFYNLQIARPWYASYRKAGSSRLVRIMLWGYILQPPGAMFVGLLLAYLIITNMT